ncbi:hypothetical protein BTJ45_03255 [Bacillus mycoides]|nr:hypothetical protein BTJ45_03255 [Bacillus mycoides]
MWDFPSWSKYQDKDINTELNLRGEANRLLNVGIMGIV